MHKPIDNGSPRHAENPGRLRRGAGLRLFAVLAFAVLALGATGGVASAQEDDPSGSPSAATMPTASSPAPTQSPFPTASSPAPTQSPTPTPTPTTPTPTPTPTPTTPAPTPTGAPVTGGGGTAGAGNNLVTPLSALALVAIAGGIALTRRHRLTDE
ncbi:hypothetical protein [Planosporangium mesophilum]|uniref:Gram-positive cocci surface proteins LPxTG domain-containing protein n=1 Tax=Planosporangium mesophilum TaxID=689768 RepID=A0A8J3THM9_9ACTN|nr:hypothetical protein [Planosporangium mesophilum]NJC86698.1 hypothetical protein [Planosporangium mesophilum]GII25676.1 hypothetical protein Pme01_52730 [Planosporangium mesophilum]